MDSTTSQPGASPDAQRAIETNIAAFLEAAPDAMVIKVRQVLDAPKPRSNDA